MHGVPGMPALYRQLVDRHPDVFARHIAALLDHRDGEIASMSGSLWRLEHAWVSDLEGRRQWQRDNTASLVRQAETLRQADRARQLGPAEAEVRRLDAAYNREREHNQALRSSWSWRLTGPLRAMLGWGRR